MEEISSIQGHIVILGWSRRVEHIVKELRNEVHSLSGDLKPILVIANVAHLEASSEFERVYFIHGDPTDLNVLRRANLAQASSLLIPADIPESNAVDGQNVFALLSALSVNPNVRVCLEMSQARSAATLDHIRGRGVTAGNFEVVSFESVADRLLAQAAISGGVTRVYDHLLSFGTDSNEIYTSPIHSRWHGKTFRELAMQCFDKEVILIGYERQGQLELNPKNRDVGLLPGDSAWFISFNKAAGLAVISQ